MKSRKYSVFFSGNLNNQRVNFYFSLLSRLITMTPNFSIRLSVIKRLMVLLKSNFDDRFSNSYIRFTNGFKMGLSPITYGQIIANSKIVLCPRGFSSAECFRHYEAMRSGCVLISEKLPDTYFYKFSPIVQIKNWSEGLRKVSELLDNPSEIERLAHLTQKWWAERCSEESSARFVFKSLHLIEDHGIPRPNTGLKQSFTRSA